MRIALVLAATWAVLASAPRSTRAAESPRSPLADLWDRARLALEAAIDARTPRPPVPVEVTWKPLELGTVELGGELLALDGADLDGDGRAELFALTAAELLVLDADDDGAWTVALRLALPGEAAAIAPRDPVGALWITRVGVGGVGGVELVVRSSAAASGARVAWRDGALVVVGEAVDFSMCGAGSVALDPGRNYFSATTARWLSEALVAVPAEFYAVACGRDLVDPAGRRVDVAAAIGTDGVVHAGCVRDGEVCAEPVAWNGAAEIGDAIAVADVDRDGRAELISAASGAPGQPDRVTVWSGAGAEPRALSSRRLGGGVPAIAAVDVDGDGALEVIAAVRSIGTTKVGLWALNR